MPFSSITDRKRLSHSPSSRQTISLEGDELQLIASKSGRVTVVAEGEMTVKFGTQQVASPGVLRSDVSARDVALARRLRSLFVWTKRLWWLIFVVPTIWAGRVIDWLRRIDWLQGPEC